MDEFLINIKERSEDGATASPNALYIITTPDEVVAIAFRAEDELAEKILQEGLTG